MSKKFVLLTILFVTGIATIDMALLEVC